MKDNTKHRGRKNTTTITPTEATDTKLTSEQQAELERTFDKIGDKDNFKQKRSKRK